MFDVTVTIEVREQDKYSSNAYSKSNRQTLCTGDDLYNTVAELSSEVLSDTHRQHEIRRQAESAAS